MRTGLDNVNDSRDRSVQKTPPHQNVKEDPLRLAQFGLLIIRNTLYVLLCVLLLITRH